VETRGRRQEGTSQWEPPGGEVTQAFNNDKKRDAATAMKEKKGQRRPEVIRQANQTRETTPRIPRSRIEWRFSGGPSNKNLNTWGVEKNKRPSPNSTKGEGKSITDPKGKHEQQTKKMKTTGIDQKLEQKKCGVTRTNESNGKRNNPPTTRYER